MATGTDVKLRKIRSFTSDREFYSGLVCWRKRCRWNGCRWETEMAALNGQPEAALPVVVCFRSVSIRDSVYLSPSNPLLSTLLGFTSSISHSLTGWYLVHRNVFAKNPQASPKVRDRYYIFVYPFYILSDFSRLQAMTTNCSMLLAKGHTGPSPPRCTSPLADKSLSRRSYPLIIHYFVCERCASSSFSSSFRRLV